MSLLGDIGSTALGGPLGYIAYKGLSGNGSTDVAQVPLETPEQAAARKGLLDFAKTGSYGNYTAGTPYTGSLGDFGLSTLESSGLSRIGQNANAGPGAYFDMGGGALSDLLTTDKYNPLNQAGMIQGLNGAIDYNTQQASDAAKRNAGFAGNLYSTDTVRNLGNVQAQGNNTKATTLASLYQDYIGKKLGAIPEAFNAQGQLDQQKQQQLTNEFSYGGLERSLNTAKDNAGYQEFQRQQQGKQGQLTALSSVASTPSNFGVPNVSVPNANPWMDVLNLLGQFGGKALGSYAGGYGAAAGAKAGA